jgi:molecular chaperone DnaK
MRREAEEHASEDQQRKDLAEAKNKAEQMIYTVRKTLEEHGDKATDDERKEIVEKMDALELARKGDDTAAITTAMEALMRASHKLAEHLYKDVQQPPDVAAQKAAEADGDDSKADDENVIDADFEVKE